jgi:hypothetical protein
LLLSSGFNLCCDQADNFQPHMLLSRLEVGCPAAILAARVKVTEQARAGFEAYLREKEEAR